MIVVSTVQRGYLFASPGVFAGQILEGMPEAVALASSDGRILFVNAAFEHNVGLDAVRLTGAPVANFVPHPPLHIGEELHDFECELVSATQEHIPVSLSTGTIADRRGVPLGLALVFRDMREVANLRSRLVISDRLAAVGQLAAGIAHEINNPIAFVHANLNLLREHWSEVTKALEERREPDAMAEVLAEGEEMIDESLDGVGRAAEIVRNVREFSHAGTSDREATDLNQLLEGVIRVATFKTTPDVSIERDFGELPLIPCSRQQIKQVFLNLIVNAIHAVGEQGIVRVTTRAESHDIVVLVEDDGCGIPPEIKPRIFDPFFTTKDVGQGTGLGLSISHEIIRNEGGGISVEAKEGPGALLCVRLPIRT
jgi:PAS domain S-box-containing protein